MKKLLFVSVWLLLFPPLAMGQSFAGKPISSYLADNAILPKAKDIYTGKVKVGEDEASFALLDSLFTENDATRPFYFLTITRTLRSASGEYAEPLYAVAREFVEDYSQDFLRYFTGEPLLTDEDFKQWALKVAADIKINDAKQEKEAIANMKEGMVENCERCSAEQKKRLNEFVEQVRKLVR